MRNCVIRKKGVKFTFKIQHWFISCTLHGRSSFLKFAQVGTILTVLFYGILPIYTHITEFDLFVTVMLRLVNMIN